MYTKRFIEETFPVKEVSEISAKEKNIRSGHISTLHIWWARRPLAASRSTAFAALIPYPEDEVTIEYFWSILNPLFSKGILPNEKKNNSVIDAIKTFIIEMSRWENSNNKELVAAAREMIFHFNDGNSPKVLDPFGGGGSIPLECLRLGCETYSNDLNPVAVVIQKCTLEYPQKYGKPGYVEREVEEIENGEYIKKKKKVAVENVLLEDVKYWGNWVFENVKKELTQFYPHDKDGSVPVGYIWARTIPCQNPSCGAEIPLIKQYWLSKNSESFISLFPYVKQKNVLFKIVGRDYESVPDNFDPSEGSVKRANCKCYICSNSVPSEKVRDLFFKGKSSQRMIAVVLYKTGRTGKIYRIATESDQRVFTNAAEQLEKIKMLVAGQLGINPIPDEIIPENSVKPRTMWLYGMKVWSDIFNDRQKLSLVTFMKAIDDIKSKLIDIYDESYSAAILSYLSLGVDRLADFGSTLCVLNPTGGRGVVHTFGRQALGMTWDYAESNPFNEEGAGWKTAIEKNESWIRHASFNRDAKILVTNNNAISLNYDNDFFDAVFTDPPYYDNINYAELSDFFYVFLKRNLLSVFPSLFVSELVNKNNEIVANPKRQGDAKKAKIFFEERLLQSFIEIYRILKTNGIASIVYAHKSTDGWETLINSLLKSNLVVLAAWPIKTEMSGKLNAQETASLMSSIYIICRKIDRRPTSFYNDVKEETKNYLSKKLDRLWNEGISGADFFIAAIGSSIEVFGKYQSVIDYEGNIIRANKLLEDVRIIVTDYAVKKILHNGFATGISDLTRFYVLCRWEFKAAKIPFDEANKLAHSCHIELADYWVTKSFIQKDKEFIQILGPQDRDLDDIKDSGELIDVLHYAVKLWEKGNKAEMQKVLNESGYAKSDSFFRVAQAISETLPNESKEKKLLEGFLNLRERISEGFKVKEDTDKGLFD